MWNQLNSFAKGLQEQAEKVAQQTGINEHLVSLNLFCSRFPPAESHWMRIMLGSKMISIYPLAYTCFVLRFMRKGTSAPCRRPSST